MVRAVVIVAMWLLGMGMPGLGTANALEIQAYAPEPLTSDRTLLVGMVVAPPFIEKDASGHLGGLSYELWRDVANDLGLRWKAVEYDLPGLLDAVRQGRVNVAVADLSITPEREAVMDFSLPFYATGLGIAVPMGRRGSVLSALMRRIISPQVLLYGGSLLGLLLVVGTVIWFAERRRNPKDFRPGRRGISDGLWWSAVTMTTVGYGDATPKTLLGRLVALVWMFASVVLLAFFTAGITSSLTVEGLGERVRGPEDLHRVRTGVKRGSSAEQALLADHVGVVRFSCVEDGVQAVAEGKLDAFVHDEPVLRYLQYHSYAGWVRVLPVSFSPQLYGFAFPPGASLRKAVNVAMLRRLDDRTYRKHLFESYLGKDAAR